MKKIFYFLLLLLPVTLIAQNEDSAWIVNNYTKKEIYIPMRDGIKLFTSIYIPKDKIEKHPILMTRTPYSCKPYGENNFDRIWYSYRKEYFKEGYIIVTQDVRGRWMSEGIFKDVRPFNPNKTGKETDEASDTYDTIDWLIKNLDNNNGNVGVFGISYPGFYSTEAALSNHPALKAVSPQAPVTDWFVGDDFHHNGAFFQMDAFAFYAEFGFGRPHPHPTTEAAPFYIPFTNDNYDFYLRMSPLSKLTKIAEEDTLRFWDSVMNHPNYDAFWKIRNARVGLYNVKPAMLEVGGLFDAEDCFGAWNVFKAIEKQSPQTTNRIVEGPWYHGQWASGNGTHLGNVQFASNTAEWYEQNIEIPFFNYYLKGKGPVDSFSKATIFFTGENQWHKFAQWPPENMKPTNLFLEDNSALDFNKSSSKTSFSEYISDPSKPVPYNNGIQAERTREYMTDDQRFAAIRPDVLVFKTDTLTEDVTIAGPLTAELMVSTSGTDADFVVKLIDVFPDNFEYPKIEDQPEVINSRHQSTANYVMNGYQMLVRGDIFRGRYRNSFEKPEPFVPNKITEVKYTMPDIGHTFKKGHRIMVQIQSSWFPLVDRNPQTFVDIYHAKESDFQKATIRIYHDQNNSSKIILPMLK